MLKIFSLLVVTALWISAAGAQSYPTRPVQIVVPSPAGGNIDSLARQLASGLSTALEQPVVVVNRPGRA